MLFKKDNLRLGLALGLIGPLLGLVIIYFVRFPSSSFLEFLNFFMNSNKMITSIGSLCLFANVILFTIYINTHRDDTAKGIFLISMLYGIGILILKILN